MVSVSENLKQDLVGQDQIANWQEMADVIAAVCEIPCAVILKFEEPELEVLGSNTSKDNPFQAGQRVEIFDHYCEATIKSKKQVLIPNALKDPKWAKGPETKIGLIAYLGQPLFWPDGEVFGTLCLLDRKENHFEKNSEALLLQFKKMVEGHIRSLVQQKKMEQANMEKEIAEARLILSNRLLKSQKNVLEKLVTGKPLTEIFDSLTLAAEGYVKNAMASILILDNSGTRLMDGSTPSFSQAAKDAFNGMVIGPLAGSCGTAAYTKLLVIVEDIDSDPRWADFRDFARSQGLKSCFSSPIIDSKGNVLGTFALTFSEAKRPTDFELGILQSFSYIAGLAIEQKRSEENIQRHATELEDFVSIASHDLQEPLRKIIAFGDRLTTKIEGADKQAKNYLDRMQNAAIRMKSLIQDLLQFSMIEKNKRVFKPTDLNDVVEKVLDDLETRINETQGQVNVKKLSTLEADPVQMHQLFLNLIGNALKFHREGVPPVLNIASQCQENGRCEITIEDNGIGIDEKYEKRIFKPFERLHGRTAYEGTGIGLTICKKIVARHRGAISVKRPSKHGITFHIDLPAQQNLKEFARQEP